MTDFLYTKQSFIRGMGSLGNLRGTVLAGNSDNPDKADLEGIASDWHMVGKDMEEAIHEYT